MLSLLLSLLSILLSPKTDIKSTLPKERKPVDKNVDDPGRRNTNTTELRGGDGTSVGFRIPSP